MAGARLPLEARESRLIEGLRLNPRKSFAGRIRGERLSKTRGISIEFADYREYAEGDDLRHLDWNVLARLEHPVLRTYRDEEDLAVFLLLDASPSMEFGEPTKLRAASKIAAVVGLAALTGVDALYPQVLGQREMPLPALRSRASVARFAAWLSEVQIEPRGAISAGVRRFLSSSRRTGLCVIVSDGLDPELPAAIRLLASRGHEPALIQILAPEEASPDVEGDLRLIDAESNSSLEITATATVVRTYLENLRKHNDALTSAVVRYGGRVLRLSSDEALEETLRRMKREGWLVR